MATFITPQTDRIRRGVSSSSAGGGGNIGSHHRTGGGGPDFISPTTRHNMSRVYTTPLLLGDVVQNNDAVERRDRRNSILAESQRNNINSPATPTNRRQSITSSNAQVLQHYSNCIKMSSENKITMKNAFALHLIDYMSDVLKTTGESTTNFQVAGCTIDASAKIYACRIDSLHEQTYKILGHLTARVENGKPAEEDEETVQKKQKKNRAQSQTIEKNLAAINIKSVDVDLEVDPIFKKTSAMFDAGMLTGLLLAHLDVQEKNGISNLVMDSSTRVDFTADEPTTHNDSSTVMNIKQDLIDLFSSILSTKPSICPSLENFSFTQWDGNEPFTCPDQVISSELAYDANRQSADSPPDMDVDPPQTAGVSDDDDYDFISSGVNDDCISDAVISDLNPAGQITTDKTQTLSSLKDSQAGMLYLTMALEPGEYSYFNEKLLRTWAGPDHWKLRGIRKAADANVQASTLTQSLPRKRQKIPKFRLDFTKTLNECKHFGKAKTQTTMSKEILQKHKKSDFLLPRTRAYEVEELFKLFLKPKFTVKRQIQSHIEPKEVDVAGYNYQNLNDTHNFCPDVAGNSYDDDDDDLGDDFTEGTSVFGQSSQNPSFDGPCLGGEIGLVPQPLIVNEIMINYAKTAKFIDVRCLKSSMWKLLSTSPQQDKENQNVRPDSRSKAIGSHSFKDVYSVLPLRVPKTTAKNLSVHIAFVCLLYLANEKNLHLDQSNMGELIISQDHQI